MAATSISMGLANNGIAHDLEGIFRDQSIRVLVIDDNPVNIKLFAQQLKFLGCDVDSSSCGDIGVELWELHDYSVIFVDCHMPKMPGKEVIRCIRGSSKFAITKSDIIAFSADVSSETKSEYLQLGADYFIGKPLVIDDLYEVLVQCLDSTYVAMRNSTSSTVGADTKVVSQHTNDMASFAVNDESPSAQVVNINYLNNLLGNDPYMQQTQLHLANMFIQQAPEMLLAMSVANKQQKMETLSHLAHKLKSSARSVGAERMVAACVAMENVLKDLIQQSGYTDVAVNIDGIEKLLSEVKQYWASK